MNVKKPTIALIAALLFEIIKKALHTLSPSVMSIPIISITVSILSMAVYGIIVWFLVAFYFEEKTNKTIQFILMLLISNFILLFLLKLPFITNSLQYGTYRVLIGVFSTTKSILYFLLIVLFSKETAGIDTKLLSACRFLQVMFGIGIVKNLYSLIYYLRFMVAGIETGFSSSFYTMMLFIFLFTHASFIYFLYRYYQYKSR